MSKLEEIIAQAVADSYYGMEAGEMPARHAEVNAGDRQLAFDVTRAIEDAAGGPDHIVYVKGSAWTMQHPIGERFEGRLFKCSFVDLIQTAAIEGHFDHDGYWRVWLDRSALMWEEVPG